MWSEDSHWGFGTVQTQQLTMPGSRLLGKSYNMIYNWQLPVLYLETPGKDYASNQGQLPLLLNGAT